MTRALWGGPSYWGIYRLPWRPCHPAMTHGDKRGATRTDVSLLHAPQCLVSMMCRTMHLYLLLPACTVRLGIGLPRVVLNSS